ncbi:MAG: hypothetical protein AB7O96_04780 [Pseudobdellovibrionaceae bacterium]
MRAPSLVSRCVFGVIVFLGFFARSNPDFSKLESKFIEKSRSVKQVQDLQSLRKEYLKLRILYRSCYLQIQKRSFPFDCFSAQKLSEKWKFEFPLSFEKIETHCSEALYYTNAAQIKNPEDVSASCLQRWKEASLDYEYAKKTSFK